MIDWRAPVSILTSIYFTDAKKMRPCAASFAHVFLAFLVPCSSSPFVHVLALFHSPSFSDSHSEHTTLKTTVQYPAYSVCLYAQGGT